MEKIFFDFGGFTHALMPMVTSGTATSENLALLKTELNNFFKDSTCKEVLFTTNTDKIFFGIKLVPIIDADDIYDYLVDDEPRRITKYMMEIDSKLLDPVMGLTETELMAIILYEVNNLVGTSEPIENARNALHVYLTSNKDHIKVTQSIHYKEILAYGLKDYLSKCASMFYESDPSRISGDEFCFRYHHGEDLYNAYSKISKNNIKLYENCEISKFIVFGWTLSLYKNIRTYRISSMRTLSRAKQLTGSRLEKMEIDNVIRRINRIDDDAILESSGMMDTIRIKMREKMRKHRINNLRMIDSSYYELNMQIRNVEDENDALYLMRQINTNIAIIDEYRNSPDCDDIEKAKWNQAMDKFIQLRDKLSSTTVYKNKNYGLFVNYPDIVENRY